MIRSVLAVLSRWTIQAFSVAIYAAGGFSLFDLIHYVFPHSQFHEPTTDPAASATAQDTFVGLLLIVVAPAVFAYLYFGFCLHTAWRNAAVGRRRFLLVVLVGTTLFLATPAVTAGVLWVVRFVNWSELVGLVVYWLGFLLTSAIVTVLPYEERVRYFRGRVAQK